LPREAAASRRYADAAFQPQAGEFPVRVLIFMLGFCILPTFDSAGVVGLGPCKQGFALVDGL